MHKCADAWLHKWSHRWWVRLEGANYRRGGNRKRPYEIGMIDMCIDGSLHLPEFLHTMILFLPLKGPVEDTRLEAKVAAVVRDGGQGDGISVCKRFLLACTCC